jgi:hypothetical protein
MPRTKKTIVEQTLVTDENSPDVKIAVMNNDIKHINDTLGRLETKFDAAIQSFATTQQLLDAIATSNLKHKEYDKAFDKLIGIQDSLITKDAEQQGAIDATRRFTTIVLTLLGFIVAAVTTYAGLHK